MLGFEYGAILMNGLGHEFDFGVERWDIGASEEPSNLNFKMFKLLSDLMSCFGMHGITI